MFWNKKECFYKGFKIRKVSLGGYLRKYTKKIPFTWAHTDKFYTISKNGLKIDSAKSIKVCKVRINRIIKNETIS